MSASHVIGRCFLGFCATALLGLAGAPSASALSPWWDLTSGSLPGHLQAGGVAKDEIQEVSVNASEGCFHFENPTNEEANDEFPALPHDATAAEVQAALETRVYGAGNVQVSGGPGGSNPYLLTFTGDLADQPQPVVHVIPSGFEAGVIPCALNGTISAREVQTGEYKGGPEITLTLANIGDAPVGGEEGHTVTISDKLPHGLKALFMEGRIEGGFASSREHDGPVTCAVAMLTCTFAGTLPPYDQIEIRIAVAVEEGEGGARTGEVNEASVSGGGAPSASIRRPIVVSRDPTPFGVEEFRVTPEEEGGSIDTQAGSHPFQITGTLTMNQLPGANPKQADPIALAKDIITQLPPGLIGNPTPFRRCPPAQFFVGTCPPQSVLGVAMVTAEEPTTGAAPITFTVPIDNLEPEPGEPARFGFLATKASPVFLDTALRTGGDYGVTLSSTNITQTASFLGFKVVFWGVPGSPAHDKARGFGCLEDARSGGSAPCNPLEQESPPPFLVMPTSCVGQLQSAVEADSWEHPEPAGQRRSYAAEPIPPMDGCDRLQFSPRVRVTPDGTAASSPTGLNVDVHVPQDSILVAEDLAESAVKDITVALPQGVAINPAGGDGLQACGEGEVGYIARGNEETQLFTPTLTEPFCPDASKIATVDIATPLLPSGQHLKGAVYLATQNSNPFGSLIAMYIVAEDPISGTLVKLPGEAHLTETGQIIGTFRDTPELAFEDAELHFFGGERAPLASPARCGAYTTNATLTPWAAEAGVAAAVTAASTFNIVSGPNGSPCPGASLSFSPSLGAGTTNINAGAFTPLTTTIGREDGNQDLQSVQLHMPAGLEGLLTSVKLCPEAQANEGTCGPESQIGETTVSAGVGSDPVTVKGGKVYLTEKYAGASFGLSIVNPVKAGPFDLEHDTASPNNVPACDCIVVRAKIEVDPHTAQLTITTDHEGPHAIPTVIDGIPVQIKKVNVTVNREHFTFNPTSCGPMSITGILNGQEGASSPLSVPFQATNCASLKFQPKLQVSTAAKSSKANGSSLFFKIAYPKGAMGSQSWFNEAKFDIPKQLPARLTTIQKACLASVFESNRAGCPPASLIGHAVVKTPVLPVPLTGPVYFVSHGGAKFPDAVLVLQGYGVMVDLVGETFINGKTGITSATFRNTPDVPFESIEVTVPTGPFSEFGANLPASAKGSFCGQKLVMPTLFKAQNGLEIHQNTRVGVTGCPKAKKVTRAEKLAAAMKACRKKPKARRAACARAARRKYGRTKK